MRFGNDSLSQRKFSDYFEIPRFQYLNTAQVLCICFTYFKEIQTQANNGTFKDFRNFFC